MKQVLVAAALVTAVLAPAQAAQAVLGIRLGKPFEIRQCEAHPDRWCSPEGPLPATNKTMIVGLMPPDTGLNALPSWIRRDELRLELAPDHRVDHFSVATRGPAVQSRAIRSISARFGKPVRLERRVKRNPQGAPVETVFALWRSGETTIVHACARADACTVEFSTAAAFARELAGPPQVDGRPQP